VSFDESSSCWVAIRTDSAESAQELLSAVTSADLAAELQRQTKIGELFPGSSQLVWAGVSRDELDADQVHHFLMSTTFALRVVDLRVIGGRILDVIDPNRASIDPMCSGSTFFPISTEPLRGPAMRLGRSSRRSAGLSASGAPRWIPAAVQARRSPAPEHFPERPESSESFELEFRSEVAGIPWIGPGTMCCPLYRCLGQVLTAMQPLFAQIGQPLEKSVKVVVKAQIYELRQGQEILGQLHQEGAAEDDIKAVGLYYPAVDETLSGGDLEITVVMTGGCGSSYPVSEEIPVRVGTAIVFSNVRAYHRMTALSCNSLQGGRRMVVAFFIVRDSASPGVPCTDTVTVNYSSKAKSMVRMATGRLPQRLQLHIEHWLTGGDMYVQQRFEQSRKVRARPVTKDGLAVRTLD